jgi:hypothetical protein
MFGLLVARRRRRVVAGDVFAAHSAIRLARVQGCGRERRAIDLKRQVYSTTKRLSMCE